MNGLIALIMVLFLVTGAAYGIGAGTMKSLTDVIKAMEKALSGLGSLILLFLIISQFVAYFNYSNMGTILAVKLADVLKDAEHRPAVAAHRLYRGRRDHRPAHHGRDRQMGHLRADLCAAADEAGRRSRSGAGGLPGRRFADEFDHAAQRLLRLGRRRSPRNTTRTRASARSWR